MRGHQCRELSGNTWYEHKLLSELPSRDQLEHLGDWPNSATAGLCKLCLVFTSFFTTDITRVNQDRHRLLIGIEGIDEEDAHDQEHFDAFGVVSGQKVRVTRRSTSRLIVGIMNLYVLEEIKDYTGPPLDLDYVSRDDFDSELFLSYRELHCCTDLDDPSVQFGVTPLQQVGYSTSSAASFEVAAAWISQCLAAGPPEATTLSLYRAGWCADREDEFQIGVDNAPALAAPCSSNPEKPTRLLEIGSGLERGKVRLVQNGQGEVPYATLSYCWGEKPQAGHCEWLTTMHNVHSRTVGMERAELPRTLQDSITVAERLGIQHIWIDSLCIIQDSDDDWAVEAAKMGEIYLGSVVTIVAASSNSAEHGCFNQRSVSTVQSLRDRDELVTLQTSFGDGRTSKLHIITKLPPQSWRRNHIFLPEGLGLESEDLYQYQVSDGPWTDRAWTLQEHVLSRRLLFYTDQMLFWECGHCRLSEDRYPQMQGDNPYPLDVLSKAASRGSTAVFSPFFEGLSPCPNATLTAETWYCRLVEDYSRRQMTFSRDKLIAIGALAKATSWGRRIPYLAGLWGDSVRHGLMWRGDGPGSKIVTSTCPSWSWASQLSPVSYEILTRIWPVSGIAAPKVLDVHVEPADERNPFGDVQSGYVMLRTKVQTARVLPDFLGLTSPFNLYRQEEWRGLFISSGTGMSQWPLKAYMDDEDVRYDEVLVAVVGTRLFVPIALLLHPPRLGAEEYRRVGIALLEVGFWCGQCPLEMQEYFKDRVDSDIVQWATRTIKIV